MADSEHPKARVGRRQMLTGALVGGGGLAMGGFALGRGGSRPTTTEEPLAAQLDGLAPVDPYGAQQAGIARPSPRQASVGISVADFAADADVLGLLARVGEVIADITSGKSERLAGVNAANLTVAVGVGPKTVAKLRGKESVGAEDLPSFPKDSIEPGRRGGDLLVQVNAEDPTVVVLAEEAVLAALGENVTVGWQISGFRGAAEGSSGSRNLLGFFDGVSVPKTPEELQADVWLDERSGLAGGTVCVVRVMPVEVGRFVAQPVAQQEAIIGRHRDTGAPLSGGDIDTDPNLNAKNDAGVYAIANDAHVRRAHPLPSGANGLMLRRSYSYARGREDQGLIFVCFQKELRTFVQTQARMDEQDGLMSFAQTTASGTFLMLPGFSADRPLGSVLAG